MFKEAAADVFEPGKPNAAASGGVAARDAVLRALQTERIGLDTLIEAVEAELGAALTRAIDMILAAPGRVIVTGMGKSGHVGHKIAATLASTGTPSLFLHPAEASHGDLGMVAPGDIILALSWSGETVELRDIIHYSRRYGVPLIALTSSADSALGRSADVTLCLPKVVEACPHNLAPTTSTLLQLAVGDAIAVTLLQLRRFTSSDFRQFHPGGKLGAALLLVRDLMRRDEALPLVSLDADMMAAIVAMTSCKLGCVIVVDEERAPRGIITDGDLRRTLEADLLRRPVREVMTPEPKTVAPEMLASAALKTLNDRKISVLVVAEAGQV
ncbi:MAG TPA: KpsF/GutQ family sugar-phosphate isomerase, partial [Acetobacteraceae bacterium]|nr:KpsF/GutQ family sugar-phosphate isomerase [Acetobacteraceae bacterium]